MHIPSEVWGLVAGRLERDGCASAPAVLGAVCRASALSCPRPDGGGVWAAAVHAASHGHADLLRWLAAERGARGEGLRAECSVAAAEGGHLAALEALWGAEGRPDCEAVYVRAAARGRTEVLRWAAARGFAFFTENCAAAAAQGGHLDALRFLVDKAGVPVDRRTLSEAAKGGHLELLMWARAEGCPWGGSTCAKAARGGHLELLRWAREAGCPWDVRACNAAARGGHLETLRYLREEGCPWDENTCSDAAKGGHLETLVWARAEGCPWDAATCYNAACGGHLETLVWARAEGCPWNEASALAASRRGHLDVLRWLFDNGCPWSPLAAFNWCPQVHDSGVLRLLVERGEIALRADLMCGPAEAGDLDTLEWLRLQGCPHDEWAHAGAAAQGHTEVLRWFREHGGLQTPASMSYVATRAARGGHIGTLEYLHSLGCERHELACSYAAEHGGLKTLRWLRERGWPWAVPLVADASVEVWSWALRDGATWAPEVADRAAHEGRLPLLRWALGEGLAVCAASVTACAAAGGQVEVLRWARRELGAELEPSHALAAAEWGHFDALRWLVAEACPWDADACVAAAAKRARGADRAIRRWVTAGGGCSKTTTPNYYIF
jgi:hypothetical protein